MASAPALLLLPLLAGASPHDLGEAAAARRAALMQHVGKGLIVVQSADRSQPNLYEFFVPDTENHDFVYLTGLEGGPPPGSTLVLNPGGETYREILYTSEDPERARAVSGIDHVFPADALLEHLSSALTDYRNLRITQLRFKPVASDLSRGLGDGPKRIHLNYPRFVNLHELMPPRLELAERLRRASPELELRDAGEWLDRMRMVQDAWGLAQLRRAIAITGRGLIEGMRAARPGRSTREVMEVVDFVYRVNGAGLGFPTGVSATVPRERLAWATAREELEARSGTEWIERGALVHFDTGAEVEHYSADVQRTVPADGRFTPEQRRVYDAVASIQKEVIAAVRPGVTWRALHEQAVRGLRDAGGWDESYTYGIGHFIGMEVHEHGDYAAPLQAGMVLAIEQGAVVDGLRVAFEDDVLVTGDGSEWLTGFIPLDADAVEAALRTPALVDPERLRVP